MLTSTESAFVTIVGDDTTLEALLPQWRELAQQSVEDCAYYSPDFALPLLRTVAANNSVRFIAAWAGNRLAAFLPVAPARVRVPGVTPAGMAWETDYTFSCTPLLD